MAARQHHVIARHATIWRQGPSGTSAKQDGLPTPSDTLLRPPSLSLLTHRRSALLQRRGVLVNLTGDERTLSLATPAVQSFLDSLPAEAVGGGGAASWQPVLVPQNEALLVPTQVGAAAGGWWLATLPLAMSTPMGGDVCCPLGGCAWAYPRTTHHSSGAPPCRQ